MTVNAVNAKVGKPAIQPALRIVSIAKEIGQNPRQIDPRQPQLDSQVLRQRVVDHPGNKRGVIGNQWRLADKLQEGNQCFDRLPSDAQPWRGPLGRRRRRIDAPLDIREHELKGILEVDLAIDQRLLRLARIGCDRIFAAQAKAVGQ